MLPPFSAVREMLSTVWDSWVYWPLSSLAFMFRPSTLAEISSSLPCRLVYFCSLTAAVPSRRALPVDSSVAFWPEMVRDITQVFSDLPCAVVTVMS